MTAATPTTVGLHDTVLDAIESRTPLRISGRSHWIDAGRPVAATRIASTAAHAGIVDYVPGDLTITVKSGTTLREIAQVTRAEGQWLPIDPYGTPDGTIGATIATGSFGPLAHGFGRTRDLVLGLEFITGEGKIVRGGGRVVKNVAGFDLVRLLTGSWGTLGIITEATLRLYSHPSRPMTVAMTAPAGAEALSQRIKTVLSAPVTPLAIELISGAVSDLLGFPPQQAILIELGGNDAAISAQLDTLSRLGGLSNAPAGVWEKLRMMEDATHSSPSIVLRLSSLPERLGELWTGLSQVTAEAGALMHATPGLGIVRCILPPNTNAELLRTLASANGITVIYERLPAGMWNELSPSVVSDRISRGIMSAFDPHGILNPGILGVA